MSAYGLYNLDRVHGDESHRDMTDADVSESVRNFFDTCRSAQIVKDSAEFLAVEVEQDLEAAELFLELIATAIYSKTPAAKLRALDDLAKHMKGAIEMHARNDKLPR